MFRKNRPSSRPAMALKRRSNVINGYKANKLAKSYDQSSYQWVWKEWPELEVVAVNDLGDINNLAYLLKYDTAYGKSDLDISVKDGNFIINGKQIAFLSEKDPAALPWGKLGVDVAVEATGFFESYEKASLHLEAGAKRVVITAPAKGDPSLGKTVLIGINEDDFKACKVSSNGSCTTNAVSPVAQIMSETVGVKKAVLNTIHAYTATQKIVDSPDAKDL